MNAPRIASLVLFTCASAACHSGPGKAQSAEAGAADGWRRSFPIDKARLGPTGGNPHFDLTPGSVHVYDDDGTVLTITVLNQTEPVDDVTTRVVEEREEEHGKLKEVSRNFLAADRITGDVYYFGEDVDVYDAAGRLSHPGAWRSGVRGATYGLFLPAAPRVGDRFYQEVAPGVAMDRVEIVAIDEVVKTPAGEFRNCVKLRESTPLEPGVGHKWFAPGVGLVKDGGAPLVSHTRRDR